MLTLQDCIGFSGLTQEQVEAVADHEHLDMVIAAEWAENAMERPGGREEVQHMIEEEIAFCESHHRLDKMRRFQHGLEDLVEHA